MHAINEEWLAVHNHCVVTASAEHESASAGGEVTEQLNRFDSELISREHHDVGRLTNFENTSVG